MANLARNLMLGVLGAATTKAVRTATRRAMHDDWGTPRLPRPARRKHGFGTALAWAAGTGAVLALADVLREQKQHAGHRA